MPSCITCGQHYKISKEYSDAFECVDCAEVIQQDFNDSYSDKDSIEYDLFHEGCSRTLPKFYED